MTVTHVRDAFARCCNILLAFVIVIFSRNAVAIIIDFDDAEATPDSDMSCFSEYPITEEYKKLLKDYGYAVSEQ